MDNFLDSLKFIAFLILIGSGLVWAFISEVKRWSDISRKETEWKEAMQAARLTKIRDPYKTIDRSRNPLFAPYFGKLDVFQQGHKTGFHTRPAVFNAYVGQMQGWNVLMSVLTYNTDVERKHSRFQRICLLVGDMRLWPYFRIFPHGAKIQNRARWWLVEEYRRVQPVAFQTSDASASFLQAYEVTTMLDSVATSAAFPKLFSAELQNSLLALPFHLYVEAQDAGLAVWTSPETPGATLLQSALAVGNMLRARSIFAALGPLRLDAR